VCPLRGDFYLTTNTNTEFDVAVSLLGQDEPFARDLVEKIGRFVRGEVFLYSRRKEELAVAGDLVERFTKVFRDEARVVVIIYRSEWGQTPFTSIEHDAIKARRGRSTDLRWVVVVSMEPPGLPDWYPATEFWLSTQTFSAEAMAAVIAERASEAGAKVGRESPGEMAKRLAEQQRRRQEREARQATDSTGRVPHEIAALLKEMKRHAAEVSEAWSSMMIKEDEPLHFTVLFKDQRLRFGYDPAMEALVARLVRGRDGSHTTWIFRLVLDENDVWSWQTTDVDHFPEGPVVFLTLEAPDPQTTPELADDFARKMVDGAVF
jgi:hypothetical protein